MRKGPGLRRQLPAPRQPAGGGLVRRVRRSLPPLPVPPSRYPCRRAPDRARSPLRCGAGPLVRAVPDRRPAADRGRGLPVLRARALAARGRRARAAHGPGLLARPHLLDAGRRHRGVDRALAVHDALVRAPRRRAGGGLPAALVAALVRAGVGGDRGAQRRLPDERLHLGPAGLRDHRHAVRRVAALGGRQRRQPAGRADRVRARLAGAPAPRPVGAAGAAGRAGRRGSPGRDRGRGGAPRARHLVGGGRRHRPDRDRPGRRTRQRRRPARLQPRGHPQPHRPDPRPGRRRRRRSRPATRLRRLARELHRDGPVPRRGDPVRAAEHRRGAAGADPRGRRRRRPRGRRGAQPGHRLRPRAGRR